MTDAIDPKFARYSRQVLYANFGEKGQRALSLSRVLLVGCGALGTIIAETMVRAGVGFLRIVDRDFVELNNLQRQTLFDEHDVAECATKAEAALRKLQRINSGAELEAVVADYNYTNAQRLSQDADLILDGTDNFEARFLMNDVAVKLGVPWVYGAVIGAEGVVMPILPGETPCLRCVWEEMPPPGTTATCDTAGVLGPVVHMVAGLQALEAMKILGGKRDAITRKMISIDAWGGRFRTLNMQPAFDRGQCPCCKGGQYEFLSGERSSNTISLCGRDAVQVLPPPGAKINLATLADRLRSHRATMKGRLLRFTADACEVTLFPDGRAIIKGTNDPAIARGVYAKYIGA